MKKTNAVLSVVLLSLASLSATAGASSSATLPSLNKYGNSTAVQSVNFGNKGAVTVFTTVTQSLSINIPEWSLGVIDGNLDVVSVNAPKNYDVTLTSAHPGSATDIITFDVTANAGASAGSLPVEVTLKNRTTGEVSTVAFLIETH